MAMEALQAGAVDVMENAAVPIPPALPGRAWPKESGGGPARIRPRAEEATSAVRARRPIASKGSSDARLFPARRVILLGASTGGTEALRAMLSSTTRRLARHLHCAAYRRRISPRPSPIAE